jgi:putative membrane protein
VTADGRFPGPGTQDAGSPAEATAPALSGAPGSTGSTGSTGTAGVTASDGAWLRVHPASPFVRGWVALAAIGFFFGRDIFERSLQGRPLFEDGFAGRVPWLVAAGGTVLLVAVISFVLTWYFTKYQVSGGYVRVNTGFLFRQQRQARLDRVQAIDIVQPLLARIFGLAELKFEVADAGESAVRLAYLKIDEARQLRATILARAAGIGEDMENPGAPAPEAPEHPVLSVPPSRLVGSLLLSDQSFFVVVGGVASVVLSAVTDNRAFYFYLIPAALGLAASYWNLFNKGYNFTAAISPDGIRLRYGLLDTQAQTLPPGRIQALKISQPPLWRLFGWYRIQVNVAGYGLVDNAGEASARTTLLPVGTLDDAMAMLSLVLPDPGTGRPAEVFGAGLTGLDAGAGFTTTPRRARFLAPLGWRRNGFTATDTALLIRSGRWWRQLVVVPHQRTQSMALHQGPLARRFRVADLVLHTTAGPVVPRLTQAGLDEARALFDAQSARARLARKRQTTEQWLRQVAPQAEAGTVDGQDPPSAPPGSDGEPAVPTQDPPRQQQEGPNHG